MILAKERNLWMRLCTAKIFLLIFIEFLKAEIFKADFWRRVMKTPIHQPKGDFKTEKFHCYLIKFGVISLKEGKFFFSLLHEISIPLSLASAQDKYEQNHVCFALTIMPQEQHHLNLSWLPILVTFLLIHTTLLQPWKSSINILQQLLVMAVYL